MVYLTMLLLAQDTQQRKVGFLVTDLKRYG
jgi:hypothetical protein